MQVWFKLQSCKVLLKLFLLYGIFKNKNPFTDTSMELIKEDAEQKIDIVDNCPPFLATGTRIGDDKTQR